MAWAGGAQILTYEIVAVGRNLNLDLVMACLSPGAVDGLESA